MRVTIQRTVLHGDQDALVAFDRKVFGHDAFDPEDWNHLESYWMVINGKRVGCCAFERDTDFDGRKRPGCLYIVSTGIQRDFQAQGLGDRFKHWQIGWARRHGFSRIVTNTRRSNRAMIRLNQKHGFDAIGLTGRNYYSRPAEAAVVMELKLPSDKGKRQSPVDAILVQLIAERDRVERAIAALTWQ